MPPAPTSCAGFYWKRYEYTKTKSTWSPRRISCAKKAVEKEAEAMALCPDLRRYSNLEERITLMDQREIRITTHMRAARARLWREARAMIRSLSPEARATLKQKWNTRFMPGTPANLFACARLMKLI